MKSGLKITILVFLLAGGCNSSEPVEDSGSRKAAELSLEQAGYLAALPLACMQTAYPNKLGQTLGSQSDMGEPQVLHPAFYGCFDWHSAVHAHWSLVKLVKLFPELEEAREIRQKLKENLSADHIRAELSYFNRSDENSYERTYGWAWLLKLAEELHSWDAPLGSELEQNLQPLTDLIAERFETFLPKLVYPIRVGEHTNTAFAMAFAWDYAISLGAESLKSIIESRARDFYSDDAGCPMVWEPSGFDFLSPCLEEIDLMRRVLDKDEFHRWMDQFAPQLLQKEYALALQYPAYSHLLQIADTHVTHSLPNLVGDSYEGGHWLGTFALYALQQSE